MEEFWQGLQVGRPSVCVELSHTFRTLYVAAFMLMARCHYAGVHKFLKRLVIWRYSSLSKSSAPLMDLRKTRPPVVAHIGRITHVLLT